MNSQANTPQARDENSNSDSNEQRFGMVVDRETDHANVNTDFNDNINVNELKNVFERITDAFVAFDPLWNYIYLNKKAAEIIGRPPENLIGKNIWEEFPEKKDDLFYQSFFTAMKEQETLTKEDYCRPLGIWLMTTMYPSPGGLSVYMQDITERKKTELALAATREQYRQIVETAQEGIWMIDENNKTVFVNQKMCDILEYSIDEMMGKENNYFMDEDERELSQQSLRRRKKGIIETLFKKFITKSGKHIWTNMSANPIFNEEGEYKGALAMVSDITDKVILQQQLMNEQMNKQKEIAKAALSAQEIERNKIGEELHDNINQLLSASNLFLGHSLNTDDYKPFIMKGRACVNEAIEEIRKLSKELVGPAKAETIGLIKTVTDLVNDIVLVKKMKIKFNYSAYCEEKTNAGLKVIIYRIIQEQFNNILKHAEATAVLIKLISTKDDLILLIKDNGKGFDMAVKRKGIGLKNIISRAETYNGNVEFISSPGKGCTMQVTFNLSK